MMTYFLAVLAVIGLVVTSWLTILLHKNKLVIATAEERIQYLQAQLDARPDRESTNAQLRKMQDKYDTLENKVKGLFLSAQNLATQPTLEKQIDCLELFFGDHFSKMPPQIPVFCKKMRGLVASDQRIELLHTQVMRPMQEMLYNQEITDDPDVRRKVIAKMIDAFWLTFDAVETLADRDNMRKEQLYAVDLLNGSKDRQEVLSLALSITPDPEKTPKWLRVIRRTVLPLNLDCQYPVLYSGYKLVEQPTTLDENVIEN